MDKQPVQELRLSTEQKGPAPQPTECKLYKRRWAMLAMFCLYSMTNAFQWIEYSIIANIIVKYYGIPSLFVDWASMIYMVVYIPLIFPATWLLDKVGLRLVLIIGALGNCVSAWIKVASVAPNLFWVSFLGQTIAGISQIFVINVPAPLAATWFGADEVSTACSIGVFGNQLGVALGFLLPPMIVRNSIDLDVIGVGLSIMFYSVAIVSTVIFFAIAVFFQASPELPPSPAQAVQRDSDSRGFLQSIKRLTLNSGFRLLFLSYGLNVSVYYALSTFLNQIVLFYFPGKEEDAGRIGLTIVVAGMFGSIIAGIVLDKSRRFKETTLVIYGLSLLWMVGFTFILDTGVIVLVYIVSGLLGLFMTGYLSVGFEFGAELTYPEPEGTSAGLLNASAQVFGICLTLLYGWLFNSYGDLWANVSLCCALFVGTTLTAFIKSDLRRQAAHDKSIASA